MIFFNLKKKRNKFNEYCITFPHVALLFEWVFTTKVELLGVAWYYFQYDSSRSGFKPSTLIGCRISALPAVFCLPIRLGEITGLYQKKTAIESLKSAVNNSSRCLKLTKV
jgi:hypothetical protein